MQMSPSCCGSAASSPPPPLQRDRPADRKGRQLAGFTREAQIEVRKVVWPTRQETTQTTLIVIMVVIIFALLLWVLDLIFSGLVQMLIRRGG